VEGRKVESELARAREAIVDVDRERDAMLAQLDGKVPTKPETRSSKPEPRNSKPETRNPDPETRIRNRETASATPCSPSSTIRYPLTPKPGTRNLEPGILTPDP
jgi:hypothetical protein